jgi:thiamine biosynthesis lipoprotein
MGSPFKLVLYSNSEPAARRASLAAFRRIAKLDAVLSDYKPDSELSRLSAAAGGPPMPVSPDLFEILERGQQLSERSGGLFDLTIAPVGRLWRRARRERKLPAADRLAEARGLVGSRFLFLDPEQHTARLERPGMKLDAGGIAKGYASQEAVRVLKEEGFPRALVAGAGDIVVGDPPPGAQGWRIGIAPVDDPAAPPRREFWLSNRAVSTSGDAERYVEIDGRRYSHIIDPRTGLGVQDRASVTVVATDGALADAAATIAYLMGPEDGVPWVESMPGCEVRFSRITVEGEQTWMSDGFPRSIPDNASGGSEGLDGTLRP